MFSTGQQIEGAVNYSNTLAVCGFSATGDNPTITNNQANLSLPVIQACAAPIGPKWVSSLTNWLCFLIDGAGLQYRAGSVCQDPLLLLDAVKALIAAGNYDIVRGYRDGALTTPPSNTLGNDGDYAISDYNGNIYGPKTSGVWPSSPAYYGNNGAIGVHATNTLTTYNTIVEMTGSSTFTTTLPTPVGFGNAEITLFNDSSVNQNVKSPGSSLVEGVGFTSSANPIVITAGQILILKSDNTNWIVTANNYYSTGGGGGGGTTYALVDCVGSPIANGGAVVTCAEFAAYTPPTFNPFTTTGVGAVVVMVNSSSPSDNATEIGIVGTTGSFASYGANIHWISDFVINDYRWNSLTPPAGVWQCVGLSLGNQATSAVDTNVTYWIRIS